MVVGLFKTSFVIPTQFFFSSSRRTKLAIPKKDAEYFFYHYYYFYYYFGKWRKKKKNKEQIADSWAREKNHFKTNYLAAACGIEQTCCWFESEFQSDERESAEITLSGGRGPISNFALFGLHLTARLLWGGGYVSAVAQIQI